MGDAVQSQLKQQPTIRLQRVSSKPTREEVMKLLASHMPAALKRKLTASLSKPPPEKKQVITCMF